MDMPTKDIENSEAELSDAEYNDIRLFRVSHSLSAEKALTDLNGEWMVCSSESARDFSAIGFLFSRELNSKLNTPVGMIQSAFGGTPIESWISLQALSENPLLNPILTTWEKWVEEYPEDPEERERITRQNEAEMKAMGKPIPPWRPMPKAPDHSHRPGSAFNAMINPLISYSIRGVLWYQGEANAPRARQYRDILPALIKNWRELWGNKDLPFLFVQLPRFEAEWLEDDIWAEIREAQSLTWRNMPETGMVVSMDRGDYLDLHPKDKKMIAIRLCLAALSVVYGENVEFSGPIYHSHKREGSNIRIFFEHTAGGLICEGKELQGFTIAGIDREFKPASAWIDNDNVLIKCDSNVPVAIRYRWANSPDGNLFNELGLPASPFRTDDWPGKTDDRVGDAIEKCVEMFL
jgi:sialate O-acetylesterase